MNDQDAFDEWFAKRDVWPRITYDEVWHAALAYLRLQGEPVAFIGERDGMLWREQADAGDTPLFLAPRTIENDDREYLSAIAHLGRAMRRLVIAARTSGGTAGPDAELMAACAQAEDAMSVGAIGRAMEAPQPAIPDGWLDRGKAALAECRAADDLWSDDRLLSRLFNAMTAATQPVAPGGWKLVPMEPTPTMLSAGAEGSGEFIEHAHFVWTQMLAAAPEPSK